MRILFVLTTLGIGGAETQTIALADRMAARGHSVTVLALKYAAEELPVRLPVLRLNLLKTPLGILRGLRFADKFLAVLKPEIVHSHTFPANLFARLLALCARLRRQPFALINTIHNVYEGGLHRMLLYRLTDPLAAQVTAVSAAAAERFVRTGAVPRSKMRVLTNGIDTQEFSPLRSRRAQTRLSIHTGRQFVWLAAGRFAPAKDYPNMLRAFALLKQPGILLLIAGEGDSSILIPPELHPPDPHSTESPVRFLGLRRDMPALLDAADGFVLSSAWEGMPLVVGEAMAMEKPIVATDVGGVAEISGDYALLAPPADPAALAAAMLQVMQAGEWERKATGRAARKRIETLFSIDARVEEWEALYSSQLKQAGA